VNDDSIEASATCSATPSAPATVPVRQNVRLTGQHKFSVTNPGSSVIKVTVEANLSDTAGHSNSNSRPVSVQPRSTQTGTMDTFLLVAYDQPGDVMITATTRITGDAFCSTSGGTRMRVTG
jgi:hypothetical protein